MSLTLTDLSLSMLYTHVNRRSLYIVDRRMVVVEEGMTYAV